MAVSLLDVRGALRERSAQTLTAERFAAVALVLREHKNGPEVLIIERAHSLRDPWSGQLAFPGGRHEPHDSTLRATAMRETLEEVGLDLQLEGEALGELDHLRAPRSGAGLVVAPFVFALRGDPVLRSHPHEVQREFWVSLQPLLHGEQRTTWALDRGGIALKLPGYQIEDRVLWGMSYQMLESLLGLLPRLPIAP
jgi:8-oxo-dGTP pyrophosphatase MutT (NUDIX family)